MCSTDAVSVRDTPQQRGDQIYYSAALIIWTDSTFLVGNDIYSLGCNSIECVLRIFEFADNPNNDTPKSTFDFYGVKTNTM